MNHMVTEITNKRVLIVGGGFAGIGCARELAQHPELRITLIDKNNYHQFQPMLYQVATSQVSPGDVSYSLRKVFARTGEVYQGDFLVLAAGSQPNFFKTPGAEQHSFPLYSLDDASRLRSRIL